MSTFYLIIQDKKSIQRGSRWMDYVQVDEVGLRCSASHAIKNTVVVNRPPP